MQDHAVTRPGFKERYRAPTERAGSANLPEPYPGFDRRRDDRERQHLPFLHLALPYSAQTLADLLLSDSPVINAEVRNNGNAAAITPVVELATARVAIPPIDRTIGLLPVGTLYPHQSRSISIAWDWAKLGTNETRIYWLFLFAVLLYDPVLDPRPNRFENGLGMEVDQPPHHIKVVTMESV